MRRVPLLIPVMLIALATSAVDSRAQYMFIDTDGDGLSTAADTLRAEAWTTLHIWLSTDRNRDGSAATCSAGAGALSINSYEFVLRAAQGAVRWGAFVNRIPDFNVHSADTSSELEYHNGFGGSVILPPGTRELATVDVWVGSGPQHVDFAPTSSLWRALLTSFGSQCEGRDGDNTLKLAVDWFDTDGVGTVTSVASAPDTTSTTLIVGSGELYLGGNRLSRPFTLSMRDADLVVNGYRARWPTPASAVVVPTATDRAQHALVLGADSLYLHLLGERRSLQELRLALRDYYTASPLVGSADIDRGTLVVRFQDGQELRISPDSTKAEVRPSSPVPSREQIQAHYVTGVRDALGLGLTAFILSPGEEYFVPSARARQLAEALSAVRAGRPLQPEEAALLPARVREQILHPLRLERVR